MFSASELLSQDKVHSKQEKVAEELLKKIKNNQPHLFNKSMRYFDFFAIVPLFRSLGKSSTFSVHYLQCKNLLEQKNSETKLFTASHLLNFPS